MENLSQYYTDKLKWSLRALSHDPEIQKSLFPPNSIIREEIIMEYEEAVGMDFERINTIIGCTQEQFCSLKKLDDYLLELYREKGESVWLNNSELYSAEWDNIRVLARKALNAFGWSLDIPNPLYSKVIYV